MNLSKICTIENETSPFGQKWKPLAQSTLKKANDPLKKKLVDKGRLVNSIKARANKDSVNIGSNFPYAPIHQFGGKTGRNHKTIIPARPFLPIDNKGNLPKSVTEEITQTILEDFFKEWGFKAQD